MGLFDKFKKVKEEFPFYDSPILYISHDEDDGMWQFLCGKTHKTDDARIAFLAAINTTWKRGERIW